MGGRYAARRERCGDDVCAFRCEFLDGAEMDIVAHRCGVSGRARAEGETTERRARVACETAVRRSGARQPRGRRSGVLGRGGGGRRGGGVFSDWGVFLWGGNVKGGW